MTKARKIVPLILSALVIAGICVAQPRGRGRRGPSEDGIRYTEGGMWRGGQVAVDENTVRTAREIATHSTEPAVWTNAPAFAQDTFTFVRIIRDSSYESPRGAGSWITDFPDSDLNLSFRLQQMTSMKVDANGRVLRLTDPDLCNYPFIYMVETGSLQLRDEEVPILRKYLLNGGVLMADDFWGEWQWEIFEKQMKRVFPDRQFNDLDMTHPIFHCVFDLKAPISKLQTPNVRQAIQGRGVVTWENHPSRDGGYEECRDMHVRAIHDDKGRIMVIATHNCDNGDGWEREGEDPNEFFFHEFSESRAYPLAINIIFYLMTH